VSGDCQGNPRRHRPAADESLLRSQQVYGRLFRVSSCTSKADRRRRVQGPRLECARIRLALIARLGLFHAICGQPKRQKAVITDSYSGTWRREPRKGQVVNNSGPTRPKTARAEQPSHWSDQHALHDTLMSVDAIEGRKADHRIEPAMPSVRRSPRPLFLPCTGPQARPTDPR
jgi:hypothetical protein